MIQIRKSADRGYADHGWLKSRHSFSFADYHDEKFMGFGPLRVINEDRIEGGTGFGTHGHKDMEIISYVVEGALLHKDSMGNETVIRPGEVQRLSAGTGIRHSEYNQVRDKVSHFLQIWIIPDQTGIEPSYAQQSFTNDFKCSDLILVASKRGRDGSITLHQDVDMYIASAQADGEKSLATFPHRRLWIQVIKGEVRANEAHLREGDGAALQQIDRLHLDWEKGAEFLIFDMP